MAQVPGKAGSRYNNSDQERDNDSHDDLYGVNVVEIVGENAAATGVDRITAQQFSGGLIPIVDYNYLDVQQTDGDTETFVFKTGGSGGTTVRTIVVNYTSSAKTDIDNVAWS